MSAVLNKYPANEIGLRLEFSRKLQAVANKIHATSNIDEIMLDLSQDICNLFDCDRLTLYALGDDKSFIVSKISHSQYRKRASPCMLRCFAKPYGSTTYTIKTNRMPSLLLFIFWRR